MAKSLLLIFITLITATSWSSDKTCYKGYRLKGQENLPPCKEETVTAETVEEAIKAHIENELGDKPRYQSQKKRVLQVNLIDQVAGEFEGKQIVDIEFLVDPDLTKTVSKNGAVIDIMRILTALSKDQKLKTSKIARLMLRPYVAASAKQGAKQILKVEINMSDLVKIDWTKTGAVGLEEFIKSKGKIVISPYLMRNGGQHFVLKSEHLEI